MLAIYEPNERAAAGGGVVIGALTGAVLVKLPALERSVGVDILVDVSGVGYEVTMTSVSRSQLRVADEVTIYIHHHIRESEQKLFGFLTLSDRDAFRGLLAAHGVGPSLALAVLATYPGQQLERILADDDLTALCQVPGVGKKTAQRLLIELKSTLVLPERRDQTTAGTAPTRTAVDDVREALENLGYGAEEVRQATAGLPDDADDSGALLKQALKQMAV